MLTGSITTFYRTRSVLIGATLAGPLLGLAGLWWVVSWMAAPRIPDGSSSAEACVRFICDERGLPALDPAERERYLSWQTQRVVRDAAFRDEFVAALRRCPPDEQQAFQAHMIEAVKPAVMADVERYATLSAPERPAYLDERIVAYNRLGAFVSRARLSKQSLKGALPTEPAELISLLMKNTTATERARAEDFLRGLSERVMQIHADPALKQELEARIAAQP